jgi:hypothetical protein
MAPLHWTSLVFPGLEMLTLPPLLSSCAGLFSRSRAHIQPAHSNYVLEFSGRH